MSCGCNKRVIPTQPANPLVPPTPPGTPSVPPVNLPK